MKQKNYVDIQNIREKNTDLTEANTGAFEVGDLIQITEKFDGSNASACWDPDENCMACFSRTQELTGTNSLNGFKEYILTLPDKTKDVFKEHPELVLFGEWSNKNKIVYSDTGKKKHWYVFDIYNRKKEIWEPQTFVKEICQLAGLEYIQELYSGPFVSWEHCKEFLHKNSYGDTQEGIVVKNQSKLQNDEIRLPKYIKIVNDEFKERMSVRQRIIDPEVELAKQNAQAITDSIVTRNRVEKMIYKLRDEGIFPEKILPTDMKLVAQNLPKRVYEDCLKEEIESVRAAGEYFSKQCQSNTMRFAKEILL